MLALEHQELLPQRKIFKNETTTGGKETSDGAEDEHQSWPYPFYSSLINPAIPHTQFSAAAFLAMERWVGPQLLRELEFCEALKAR
jgi:hypothetical protein